jgi:hypothetical protein
MSHQPMKGEGPSGQHRGSEGRPLSLGEIAHRVGTVTLSPSSCRVGTEGGLAPIHSTVKDDFSSQQVMAESLCIFISTLLAEQESPLFIPIVNFDENYLLYYNTAHPVRFKQADFWVRPA